MPPAGLGSEKTHSPVAPNLCSPIANDATQQGMAHSCTPNVSYGRGSARYVTKVAVRRRGCEDVRDAYTAGAVWPRGSDGHRAGGRRLRGSLPQMRDHGADSGNLRGGATGAVKLGAEKPTIAIASPLRICLPWRLPACPKRPDLILLDDLGLLGEVRIRRGVSLAQRAPNSERAIDARDTPYSA
jgi:hypothetical protein